LKNSIADRAQVIFYIQPASDLHHTILSLFTATAAYAPYMAQLADYLEAVDMSIRYAQSQQMETT
jgi:hypothetical protein